MILLVMCFDTHHKLHLYLCPQLHHAMQRIQRRRANVPIHHPQRRQTQQRQPMLGRSMIVGTHDVFHSLRVTDQKVTNNLVGSGNPHRSTMFQTNQYGSESSARDRHVSMKKWSYNCISCLSHQICHPSLRQVFPLEIHIVHGSQCNLPLRFQCHLQ